MPSDSTGPLMTDAEVAAVRDQVVSLMAGEGLSRQDAARESGVAYPTLSAWLNARYDGRNDKVADQLHRWMSARQDRAAARAMTLLPSAFVMTPSAEAIMLRLTRAQAVADIALITGQSGIGKSAAGLEYQRRTPQVWRIECDPSISSPRTVLEELAAAVGVLDSQALNRMQRDIVAKLRGTGGLILVDEANHLGTPALEQLRSIHDKAEVGLALMGNPTVTSRLEGKTRRAEFAQLFSRVGVRLTSQADHARRLPSDVEALLDAWAVTDPAVRRRLRAVARTDGALRALKKVMAMAKVIAAGEALAPVHVDGAFHSVAEERLAVEGAE